MPNGLLNLALGLAVQVGSPGPSQTPNFPAPVNAYNQYGFEGSAEQRYPFDTPKNWVHGYYQELPAYGGHHMFRPYNYKDVLSQSQTSAGWGERPNMPYSQQFWHKYHDQATMIKTTQAAPIWTPRSGQRFASSQPQWIHAPSSQMIVPSAAVQSYSYPAPQNQSIILPDQDQGRIIEEPQGPPIQQLEFNATRPISYQTPSVGQGTRSR